MMNDGNEKLTALDIKLREMAMKNWAQFSSLIGKEAIIKAKVCLLRQQNKTHRQIGIRLSITERQARYACVNCPEISDTTTKPVAQSS